MRVTIYSRPGCHLCDQMKVILDRTVRTMEGTITIEEVDISNDADLKTLYGSEVPVLMIDGRKAAKYRISEMELLRLLRARRATDGAR